MKKKVKLTELNVQSFRTDLVKGGFEIVPHTGGPTLDVAGCNTLNDFYCDQQSNGRRTTCMSNFQCPSDMTCHPCII